jgi:hypothetical protein
MSHATQLHNRGYLADSMQIRNRCALLSHVQDEVYRQVHAWALATVKWTLEPTRAEEVTVFWAVPVMSDASSADVPKKPIAGPIRGSYGPSTGVSPALRGPNCAAATPP